MTTANIETFIIFQSLGLGHLARSSAIARALSSISHVTMFSAGKSTEGYLPPSGVDFVQLPGIYLVKPSDPFSVPVDPRFTMAEVEQMCSELLVESYFRIRPRIIIVEHFPFTPKRFGKTLNKLFATISQAQVRPIVICSIRTYPPWWDDTDPAWINERLRVDFSCVLHHTDAKLFPLLSLGSYLQSALSGIAVWQTGFVRRPLSRIDRNGSSRGLLLTVGGGGALGAELLEHWLNAAKAGSADLFPINAVCGPRMDANDRRSIRLAQDANIAVHDWTANMDELLSACRAVVCMGGYNTLVEALSLKKPVLAFPHGDIRDQVFQVNALHSLGLLLKGDRSQSEHEITALMNSLLDFSPQHAIDCNGAERSVEIVRQLLDSA